MKHADYWSAIERRSASMWWAVGFGLVGTLLLLYSGFHLPTPRGWCILAMGCACRILAWYLIRQGFQTGSTSSADLGHEGGKP